MVVERSALRPEVTTFQQQRPGERRHLENPQCGRRIGHEAGLEKRRAGGDRPRQVDADRPLRRDQRGAGGRQGPGPIFGLHPERAAGRPEQVVAIHYDFPRGLRREGP